MWKKEADLQLRDGEAGFWRREPESIRVPSAALWRQEGRRVKVRGGRVRLSVCRPRLKCLATTDANEEAVQRLQSRGQQRGARTKDHISSQQACSENSTTCLAVSKVEFSPTLLNHC